MSSSNPTDTKQQYEGAILNQLIKNSERLVVLERDMSEVKSDLAEVKKVTNEIREFMKLLRWIGGGVAAILLSLVANFLYSLI